MNSLKNYILYSTIIILALILVVREGCNRKSEDKLISDITSYKDSAKIEKLKNGALIYTNTALKLNSEKQLRELAASISENVKLILKNFKSVSNVTYITNEFNTFGDTAKNQTIIPCDFKPFKTRHGSDSTYNLVMTIAKDYNTVDSLNIKDSIALVFGRKKVGFMKYDYAVDINHSNYLMKTTNIKNYQFKPEKKWYEKTITHMGIGGTAVLIIIEGLKYLIP
jgi:hypothetical protein